MTVLTLSMYHPQLRKQIILATMDCEYENKDNCELFCRTWNDALADLQAGITFDPAGVILDERGCNWNALKEAYGKDVITRCSSSEFHFKYSVNRRLNETVFSGDKQADRFRSLLKRMLEAQTEVQFEDTRTELRAFIDEKEKWQPLSNWLAWWATRKGHIFSAFKSKNAPESNLAEVVHSAWVTPKKTQLSLFESAVDDICDMITTKQMLKGYGDGSFGGGTGPSIQCLDKRKCARNDSILTRIM